jgi:DNA-binding MarR family transcriptional regulator
MDIYKENFTQLEKAILRFLFSNSGRDFNQRRISIKLNVSPTAISNAIKNLNQKGLVQIEKNQESRVIQIKLKLNNKRLFQLKRVENLRSLYISGLVDYLSEVFSTETIILFGSFSRGEDNYLSDIDIAIIGATERNLKIEKFEKLFGKKIIVQFFDSFKTIHKELKEGLANGIVLQGGFEI